MNWLKSFKKKRQGTAPHPERNDTTPPPVFKKLLVYPLSRIEAVEEFLEIMECNGLRLKCVYFCYLFEFVKSAPKCVHYTYSCSFVKDYEMLRYEYEIRKQFDAEKIPSIGSGGISIHRICIPNVDLNNFKEKRNRYTLRLLLKKIFFTTICLLGSLCTYVEFKAVLPWFIIVVGLCSAVLIYYIVCYILRNKKDK